MRTNIFCTKSYLNVNTSIADSYADISGNLGIVKADSNGNKLDNFLNLVMISGNVGSAEISRVIPISLCNLNIKSCSLSIVNKNTDGTILSYNFNASELVNEEIGFRLTIPAGFNHRHSWTFSYKIKPGDTTDAVIEKLNNMILSSSIKEHVGVYINNVNVGFLLNEEHNAILAQPLDAMPSDGIAITRNLNQEGSSIFSTVAAIRNYLIKLAVDADANYGFDYVDNAFHELYPNQLSYKDIEKYIMGETNTTNGTVAYTVFHITFTEPRHVETTGDVVKQVINIICPSDSDISTLMENLASAAGIVIQFYDDEAQPLPNTHGGSEQSSGGGKEQSAGGKTLP